MGTSALRSHDIPTLLERLRDFWEARSVELQIAGWKALKTWTDVTFSINCPPFGVRTQTKTRCCRRPLVCPFCYSRQRILEPFRKFESLLYGKSGPFMQGQELWERENKKPITRGAKLLPLLYPDLQLLWFRRQIHRTAVGHEMNLGKLGVHVEFMMDHINKTSHAEYVDFKAKFADVQFHVFPIPKIERMAMVRGGVLLVPRKVNLSAILDQYQNARAKHHHEKDYAKVGVLEITKNNLALAFAKAFSYPRELLRGPPQWVAETLNLLYARKMARPFGPWPKSKTTFKKPRGSRGEKGEDGWW